jgi:hypothetical protein
VVDAKIILVLDAKEETHVVHPVINAEKGKETVTLNLTATTDCCVAGITVL